MLRLLRFLFCSVHPTAVGVYAKRARCAFTPAHTTLPRAFLPPTCVCCRRGFGLPYSSAVLKRVARISFLLPAPSSRLLDRTFCSGCLLHSIFCWRVRYLVPAFWIWTGWVRLGSGSRLLCNYRAIVALGYGVVLGLVSCRGRRCGVGARPVLRRTSILRRAGLLPDIPA